jgi:hypothetical protein
MALSGRPQADSPIERLLRVFSGAGDEYERELGSAIGRELAHSLRVLHGGWGTPIR